mmetsp:Transcript_137638/g.383901  ORF Transcript_137638/g.383901 Transcript_137638/m.383901 type:complete len:211 (+) Transcript_137638:91-723(+)
MSRAQFLAGGASSCRRRPTWVKVLLGTWLALQGLLHDCNTHRTQDRLTFLGTTTSRISTQRVLTPSARPASLSGRTRDAEGGGGQIWVNQPGEAVFDVRWAPGETIADLKAAIAEKTGIPTAKQELRAGGKALEADGHLLEKCAVTTSNLEVWLFDERTPEEKQDVLTRAGRQYVEPETETIDGVKLLVYVMGTAGFLVVFASASGLVSF